MSTNEFAVFETLDLAPIKMKLMHVESGEGWSALRADAVEMEYRRFLFLMKKYPDAQASPTVDVDTFWHYHILDTLKYARDCNALFGYFLHHYPYVGIGASANDGDHAAAGERMRKIYNAEFGAGPATPADWGYEDKRVDATAWSYSPGKRIDAIAWSYSPGKRLDATAWSYSPGKPIDATAWSYSPGGRVDSSAWDIGASYNRPGKSGLAANAANASCISPGKQSQAQPEATERSVTVGKELSHAA